MKTTDERIIDAIMSWMALLWVLLGACMLGLILSIIKAVLLASGIENNL